MALSDLFARSHRNGQDLQASVQPTKVLDRFLAGVRGRTRPVLLDLGPVVGSNVTFFGEEVGCKLLVADLSSDIDRHVTDGKPEGLPAFFSTRFQYEPESIDGILCWDIFDFLERPAAEQLARQLKHVLRPDGLLLAFFSTADPGTSARPSYTKHIVVDRTHLEYRPYAATRPRQRPMLNRDIQRLLDPLRITESFLLKTNLREVLFRKPAVAVTAATPPAAP